MGEINGDHDLAEDVASGGLRPDQLARLRTVIEETPESVGGYEIVRRLGEGGFGIVYEARQRDPVERTVAIKLLKRGMDSTTVLRRFERERQSLASMSHPGIATVFDAGIADDGRHYFVMEYVDGSPITSWADDHRLSIGDRLLLIQSVCDAITHAHQKGVIHRDLKPSNVLVSHVGERSQVKVIDFGIAKAIESGPDSATQLTHQSTAIGTPEYMSPEQTMGQAELIDTRTDVFALGVLLYELLVGELPFSADDIRRIPIDEALRRIREEDPPRPGTRLSGVAPARAAAIAESRRLPLPNLRRQLREELGWIPIKAMRKSPSERYQSPAELSNDIDRFLRDEPLIAGPESTTYRLRKFIHKHRWPVAATLAIASALLMGVVGTGVMAWRAGVARDDAVAQKRLADDALLAAERSQGVAENEAATTAAMNDFLIELLWSATPGVSRGDEVPVSAVVKAALKDLDERFPDRPRVRLRMRMVLSDILVELGRAPETADAVSRAVAEAEDLFGPDDELTLSLMNSLAAIEAKLGRYRRAIDSYRDLKERCERAHGQLHRNTLIVVVDLASTLATVGRFDEAEQLFRRAIEGRTELLGERDYETLDARVSLVNLLGATGRTEEALDIIEGVCAVYNAGFRADSIGRLAAVEAHAGILWNLERFEEAEPLYREVLKQRTKVFGRTHPDTLNAMNNLALVLDNQDKAEKAEPLLRSAYGGYSELYGAAHLNTIAAGNNLGTALESLDRFEEAALIYEEVYDASQSALGETHPTTIGIASNLASLLRQDGQLEESERVLLEAQQRLQASESPSARAAAMIERELGRTRDALAKATPAAE